MKKIFLTMFLFCIAPLFSLPTKAADTCKMVLCMYGKTITNSTGDECHSAERSFFNIVKKNKHGFLPDDTADARRSFLYQCSSADPAVINQIIARFGHVRG